MQAKPRDVMKCFGRRRAIRAIRLLGGYLEPETWPLDVLAQQLSQYEPFPIAVRSDANEAFRVSAAWQGGVYAGGATHGA